MKVINVKMEDIEFLSWFTRSSIEIQYGIISWTAASKRNAFAAQRTRLSIIASNPRDAMAQSNYSDAGAGSGRLSFLSGPGDEAQQPAKETPRSMPPEDNKNFDGASVRFDWQTRDAAPKAACAWSKL
jgi:hypothetical protein